MIMSLVVRLPPHPSFKCLAFTVVGKILEYDPSAPRMPSNQKPNNPTHVEITGGFVLHVS